MTSTNLLNMGNGDNCLPLVNRTAGPICGPNGPILGIM